MPANLKEKEAMKRITVQRENTLAQKQIHTNVLRKERSFTKRATVSMALCTSLVLGMASHAVVAQDAVQNYPSKPVRLLVSSGGSDAVGRLLAAKLGEVWGRPVVADIRSGASGLITLEALAQSAPDGYTVAMVTLSQMLSTLENKRRLLASEYEAVSFVGSTPFAIAISATIPVSTFDEWITYVKAQPPGKVAYASSGQWASAHVCMEDFNARTGLNMLHVPYKTSTAGMLAVVTGEVSAYCSAAANAVPQAKAGKIRLIGSTYKEASDLLPGVPPIAGKLPGFEVQGWYGIVAPLRTPKELVSRISTDLARVIKSPEQQQTFNNMGIRPDGSSPERFAAFLKEETQRWSKVVQANTVKP